MLSHNSKSYINQAIQFKKIYHSTSSSTHSSFKFHQTIRISHQQIYYGKLISPLFNKATQIKSHHSLFIEDQTIKKEIDKRKIQEKNGHRFLQLVFFIDVFMYNGFNYKDRKKKIKQGRSFLFPIILRGKVHIYWFKHITRRRGREFRDLYLW